MKVHHMNKSNEGSKKIESNIVYIDHDVLPDIYPLVKFTDVLITDYSSIFFDYILLDRPVIFAPFDFKKKKKKVGFFYNYFEIVCGPITRNWNEVANEIDKSLNGKDTFKDKRHEVKSEFNKFKDGKSSKRVFELVESVLDKSRQK